MRVLGAPIETTAERDRRWRTRLTGSPLDVGRQLVPPDEARRAPFLSARLRASVLLRTYRGHYHGDVFDPAHSGERILNGGEQVLFWGEEDSIERLRRWIGGDAVHSDRELEALAVGTATALDASAEFGPGYAELGKGGTVTREVFAAPAAIAATLQSFSAPRPPVAFISSVRNCLSKGDLVGGLGNHRLNVHELRSSFWGIALWFVFAGGLEMSDYRELYRDPSAARASLQCGERLFCAREEDARFLADLLAFNLGENAPAPDVEAVDAPCGNGRVHWDLEPSGRADFLPYNRVRLVPGENGRFLSLADAVSEALRQRAATVVASLPLSDRGGVAAQRELDEHGFRLSAFSPGLTDSGPGHRTSLGLWARPNGGLPIVPPYYLESRRLSPVERRLAATLRARYEHWSTL